MGASWIQTALLDNETLYFFGKARIVKECKKGKVLDRGLTMMFMGYSENHAESVF
jgi:hypothetical protein